MKQGILEIKLISDLCDSDGGVYNSSLDIDVCHDALGFPFIPAKRIRGVLRECALELNEWGMDISSEELFGKGGDKAVNQGKVRISNAYLCNYQELKNEVSEALSTTAAGLFHAQNVLDHFSYVRNQTSIDYETGTADPTSLRSVRVVNKGKVFKSEIFFEDQLEEKLINVIRIFHHMGIGRTRGLGEVQASLKNIHEVIKSEKTVQYPDDADTLTYEIELLEPVICKSPGGSQEKTVDYIDGAKIIGVIANRIHDNNTFLQLLNQGELYFSNAYLENDGRRLTEVPASVYSKKNNKTDFIDKLYETEAINDQVSHMKHCYVTDDGDFIKKDVLTEIRYHHSRPGDKSVGRVDPQHDTNSQFYQISSIASGQKFMGFIQGTPEQIKRVIYELNKNENCLIGYGRSSEYGRCLIHIKDVYHAENKKIHTNRIALKLNAPALIYSQNAMASTDRNDLLRESLDILKISENNISHMDMYLNYGETGGFNVTWGMKKPVLPVFDQGTVIDLHLREAQDISLKEPFFIGERCTEGFGEAMVLSTSEEGQYLREYYKEKETVSAIDLNIKNRPFLQKIVEDIYVKDMKADTARRLMKRKLDQSELKPVVANMSLMCKEQSSLADVEIVCNDRFNKKGTKKTAKWEASENILREAEKSEEEFSRQFMNDYHIHGLSLDSEVMKFIYLKEYLRQIKYSIRQNEKAKGDDNEE